MITPKRNSIFLWHFLVLVADMKCSCQVMWSETVGLRTRQFSDQNKSVLVLFLVLQFWCCVVKHGLIIRSSS